MQEYYRYVDPQIKKMLPDVFIDYLWQLTLSERESDVPTQKFELMPIDIGGQSVQQIVHAPCAQHQYVHRVFGVSPINGQLEVHYDGNCLSMHLA